MLPIHKHYLTISVSEICFSLPWIQHQTAFEQLLCFIISWKLRTSSSVSFCHFSFVTSYHNFQPGNGAININDETHLKKHSSVRLSTSSPPFKNGLLSSLFSHGTIFHVFTFYCHFIFCRFFGLRGKELQDAFYSQLSIIHGFVRMKWTHCPLLPSLEQNTFLCYVCGYLFYGVIVDNWL